MTTTPPKLQPALLGGAFIGVLSALPLINIANCCCLWVIGGGVLAAYLMQQNYPYAITAADGALVGLLAGFFGGIIGTFISIPIDLMLGPVQQRLFERVILSNPDVPEETRAMLEQMAARSVSGMMIAFRLVLGVIIGAIFGMLGGLLGVAIFKKNLPPPPPPGGVEILPPEGGSYGTTSGGSYGGSTGGSYGPPTGGGSTA
jgi:hypothetical protein